MRFIELLLSRQELDAVIESLEASHELQIDGMLDNSIGYLWLIDRLKVAWSDGTPATH